MSEHVTKGHTVAALIVLIVIGVLLAWGFGIMNGGDLRTGAVPGLLLIGFGTFVVLALGPDGDDA